MNIPDVYAYLKDDLKKVEAMLHARTESPVDLVTRVSHHILDSGGKRLRPVFLLLAADLCGYRGPQRVAMACVVEFTHTATLLHDDVVDAAKIRRGLASANELWGNPVSVLVGDFLLSQGVHLVVENGNPKILHILAESAIRMSEGEILQYSQCGDLDISEADYLEIIRRKTALLISGTFQIGAVLGQAPPEKEDALAAFGLKLGLAFQLVDDYLDYSASEADLGKAIGKDLEEGKLTLPLIHALKQASDTERERITRIVHGKFLETKELAFIQDFIRTRGGLDYTRQLAERCIAEGIDRLSVFDSQAPAYQALVAVSRFILERDR